MDKVDAIFFIGPQGSGKGTQARELAERLGFFYWEMSSVIREAAHSGTEKGNKYLELMRNGILLTDDDIVEISKDKLAIIPLDQGIIFDAIPRRIGQANFIIGAMRDRKQQGLVTIFIDLPREESVKRLLHRADIEHRADDTQEKIEVRLNLYEEETLPILDFMRQETKFITIDGIPSIEEVKTEIYKQLELK